MFFFLFLFLYEMYENKRERERAELRLNHRALNIDDDVIYISQSKVEPFILFHFIFVPLVSKWGSWTFFSRIIIISFNLIWLNCALASTATFGEFDNNFFLFLRVQAMNGFLMMMTQNGKLLYISDNAAEYLGHSMAS